MSDLTKDLEAADALNGKLMRLLSQLLAMLLQTEFAAAASPEQAAAIRDAKKMVGQEEETPANKADVLEETLKRR